MVGTSTWVVSSLIKGEGEEILERLVDLNLLSSLLAVSLSPVEYLHVVSRSYFEAIVGLLLLIQWFFHSSDVVLPQPSVVHEFDS